MKVIAFDIYGTLIDTGGITALLEKMVGGSKNAKVFSDTWRNKQLEYSFRRGLMQKYKDFSVCTSDSLNYVSSFLKAPLTNQQKKALLEKYSFLPIFADVKQGLEILKAENYSLFAFSNGKASAVEKLLTNAGIKNYFLDIISVDDIKTFKPNPAVYHYFLKKTKSNATNTWLISSNPFDVIGAVSAGLKSVWLKRDSEAPFDYWEISPTVTTSSLLKLTSDIKKA